MYIVREVYTVSLWYTVVRKIGILDSDFHHPLTVETRQAFSRQEASAINTTEKAVFLLHPKIDTQL